MLVGAFNQEKALVGAFSVIVKPVVEPMDRFAALVRTLGTFHWAAAAQHWPPVPGPGAHNEGNMATGNPM